VSAKDRIDDYCCETLQKTFHVLAATPNDCADATLIGALDSHSAEVVMAATKAILVRNSTLGKNAIIDHWQSVGELVKPIFAQFPGRLTPALTKRTEADDFEIARRAIQIAIDIDDFDFVPTLVRLLENRRSPLIKDAEAALAALTQSLHNETYGRRSYTKRRNPQLARIRVVSELENSLGRFDKHRSNAILESFLVLAGREHTHLARLLSVANGAPQAQQETLALLRKSAAPGIMRLLASFLDDPTAPLTVLQIAAQRVDTAFIEECLMRIDRGVRETLAKNLARVADWQWLSLGEKAWATLYEREQSSAVLWVIGSGMPRENKLAKLKWFLKNGRPDARLRAAEALADFQGEEVDALVLENLDDGYPRVRSELLSQLRPRGIFGALTRLIKALEDRDQHVRAAVQKQLPEFKFRRYVDLFDSMDLEMQHANGRIVRRVDPDWQSLLLAELQSETRLRRLRALRIAQCMEAGDEVYLTVIPFASDEEALARQQAIRVLGSSKAPEAVETIRQALLDPQVTVRQAAEEMLKRRAGSVLPIGAPSTHSVSPAAAHS
jgi:HEAT repeat protein